MYFDPPIPNHETSPSSKSMNSFLWIEDRLKIKTIISLTPQEPADHLHAFCKENDIAMKWRRVVKPKDTLPISLQDVLCVLQVNFLKKMEISG